MGTEIRLGENCRVFYASFPVRLRRYDFEYTTSRGITHERYYEISFVTVDCENKFKVESFNRSDTYFDSFEEAETYIFERFGELKSMIEDVEKEVTAFIKRGNKRKRGSKKSA